MKENNHDENLITSIESNPKINDENNTPVGIFTFFVGVTHLGCRAGHAVFSATHGAFARANASAAGAGGTA
jgi:hypothetical protein